MMRDETTELNTVQTHGDLFKIKAIIMTYLNISQMLT